VLSDDLLGKTLEDLKAEGDILPEELSERVLADEPFFGPKSGSMFADPVAFGQGVAGLFSAITAFYTWGYQDQGVF
jgi:hypothetical protein